MEHRSFNLGRPVRSMRRLWLLLITAAALSSPFASAQFAAITTQHVNMRAGPDRNWPLVAWIPGGTPVNVMGCIDAWRWCDVVWGFNRGWVFGRFLSMMWQNQPTVILGGGSMMGVPLIGFNVNAYWGLHYRSRPWWNQRNQWASRPPTWVRPPPPRPPARPPVRPVPPIGEVPPQRPPGGRPPSGGNNRPGGPSGGGGRPSGGGSSGGGSSGGRPDSGGGGGGGRPSGSGRPDSSGGGGGRGSGSRDNTRPDSGSGG